MPVPWPRSMGLAAVVSREKGHHSSTEVETRILEGGFVVRSRRVGSAVSAVLALILVFGVSGMVFGDSGVIKVGSVGPLTGDVASFGQSVYNAITLAFEQVNANGGVIGKKIQLIHEDNKGDAAETTNAVRKLIVRDRVSVILGAVISANTLAAAPIAQQFKIPMLSPTSTNDKVTQAGPYVFRACYTDSFQGEIMAEFAAGTLKFKRVATLTNIASDYSIGLTKAFTGKFKSLGGTIVAAESYNSGDQDFRAQLTKIKAANPEAVYVPAYYSEAGLIARQARQLGITAVLLGPDGFDSPKLLEIGGETVYGAYFTNHYSIDDPSPLAQKFLADYRAKYKKDPDALGALGYDAALMLIDAIKRAKSDNPEAIRKALASTKNLEVVTGVLSVGPDRNLVKSAVILKVTKDGFKFVKRVDPTK